MDEEFALNQVENLSFWIDEDIDIEVIEMQEIDLSEDDK